MINFCTVNNQCQYFRISIFSKVKKKSSVTFNAMSFRNLAKLQEKPLHIYTYRFSKKRGGGIKIQLSDFLMKGGFLKIFLSNLNRRHYNSFAAFF